MGIKRLKTFLEERLESANPPRSLPDGTQLLIDGSGWAHHLAKLCDKHFERGGDYKALDRAIRENVAEWRAAGLTVGPVYYDGSVRRLKKATEYHRAEQRQQAWAALQGFCLDGATPPPGVNFPFPLLINAQLRATLRDLAVPELCCEGEADQPLAKACAEDSSRLSFVLGGDTDFLLFAGCRYVEFESLRVAPSGDGAVARVWERSKLAEIAGVSEEALVEWALLLGNDFTAHFPLDAYEGLEGEERRVQGVESGEVMHELLRFVGDKGPGWRLSPNREWDGSLELARQRELAGGELALAEESAAAALLAATKPEDVDTALRFSRALYQLEALDAFPVDNDDRAEDGSPHVHFPAEETELSEDTAAAMAAAAARDLCAAGNLVDSAQLAALARVPALADGSNSNSKLLEEYPANARPAWEDVCVSYAYQRILRRLLERLWVPPPPCECYDGRAFHAAVFAERKRVLSAGPPVPATAPPRLAVQLKRVAADRDGSAWYEDLLAPDEIGRRLPAGADVDAAALLLPDGRNGGLPLPQSRGEELPIDGHRERIVEHVANNRVTIIHGETGCGKSSRVPLFLYDATPNARMFISQPRKIAVKALLDRVRQSPGMREVVGMRMGHGVRDEGPGTRLWFVTTGYLVRLLAHHPETFSKHTHLVIDEVHERSVDTDLLCLFARRLLHDHPTIRLVLMSATMAGEMYREYFGVPEQPLFVGARRFPLDLWYSEDLPRLRLPQKMEESARRLSKRTEEGGPPAQNVTSLQHSLAVQVARMVGKPGSSVLIFVSGILDIIEIKDQFERLKSSVVYKVLPIHSDLPFEEQMEAFKPSGDDEVKIVIATNAAESSVTLPDVDNVIDLGAAKQIEYNPRTHRTQLVAAWISRASAIQRAGRTGRVRPGRVFRLYSKALFEEHMDDYEEGEMHRQPLDSVILSMRCMLGGRVVPVLQESIEPPDMSRIERSFQSLFDMGFFTEPGDEGELTGMGDFVSGLGIDLQIARLIGIGAQFDVLPEALVLAAVLSQPRTPFRITTPLVHEDPDEYNGIVSSVMMEQAAFDGGWYSEPLMLMRLLHRHKAAADKDRFCQQHALAHSRMRQLRSTVSSLKQRVSGFLRIPEESLEMEGDPADMSPATLNLLRCLLVWAFPDGVISCGGIKNAAKSAAAAANEDDVDGDDGCGGGSRRGSRGNRGGSAGRATGGPVSDGDVLRVALVGPKPDPSSISSLLPPSVPCNLTSSSRRSMNAGAECVMPQAQLAASVSGWVASGNAAAAWLVDHRGPKDARRLLLWLQVGSFSLASAGGVLQSIVGDPTVYEAAAYAVDGAMASSAPSEGGTASASAAASSVLEFVCLATKSALRSLPKLMDAMPSAIATTIDPGRVHATIAGVPSLGEEELQRLFGVPAPFYSQTMPTKQLLMFTAPPVSSTMRRAMERYERARRATAGAAAAARDGNTFDLIQNAAALPLVLDIPLGARILGAMATGYKDRMLRLWTSPGDHSRGITSYTFKPPMPQWHAASVSDRGGQIFMPRNSLASAAVHQSRYKEPLYGVAANMLDLAGGGARAEGITLLPPGEDWLATALLAFGLPVAGLKHKLSAGRVEALIEFHARCSLLGENVAPRPELARELNRLFGYAEEPAAVSRVPAAASSSAAAINAASSAATGTAAGKDERKVKVAKGRGADDVTQRPQSSKPRKAERAQGRRESWQQTAAAAAAAAAAATVAATWATEAQSVAAEAPPRQPAAHAGTARSGSRNRSRQSLPLPAAAPVVAAVATLRGKPSSARLRVPAKVVARTGTARAVPYPAAAPPAGAPPAATAAAPAAAAPTGAISQANGSTPRAFAGALPAPTASPATSAVSGAAFGRRILTEAGVIAAMQQLLLAEGLEVVPPQQLLRRLAAALDYSDPQQASWKVIAADAGIATLKFQKFLEKVKKTITDAPSAPDGAGASSRPSSRITAAAVGSAASAVTAADTFGGAPASHATGASLPYSGTGEAVTEQQIVAAVSGLLLARGHVPLPQLYDCTCAALGLKGPKSLPWREFPAPFAVAKYKRFSLLVQTVPNASVRGNSAVFVPPSSSSHAVDSVGALPGADRPGSADSGSHSGSTTGSAASSLTELRIVDAATTVISASGGRTHLPTLLAGMAAELRYEDPKTMSWRQMAADAGLKKGVTFSKFLSSIPGVSVRGNNVTVG